MKYIKCVIWDLDNTIWQGTLLENDNLILNEKIIQIIKELDRRGILNSIASKNIYEDALKKLQEFGIADLFLYPEINMGNKSESIKKISENLNLSLDTMAFVDDQDYELAQVQCHHTEVSCFKMDDKFQILDLEAFNPRFITDDSGKRRKFYQYDIKRKEYENKFQDNQMDFLKSLKLNLKIQKAEEDDLRRIEELTIRTHQLNSTGITYDYADLLSFIDSKSHVLLVSEMNDKFGEYGKCGVTLIEKNKKNWIIKLHLMSCRVMSRGVGNVILTNLIQYTQKKGISLYADFVKTERNKNMYLSYKILGFSEESIENDYVRFKYSSNKIPKLQQYVSVETIFI